MEFFRGTPIVVMEFFRILVKLMRNSSVLPIIVMEFFRDKGFEILQAKAKVF